MDMAKLNKIVMGMLHNKKSDIEMDDGIKIHIDPVNFVKISGACIK